MKKLLLLLFVVLIVFIVYNKQRIYLRDPLASVTRDGVKEEGAQVFINYSNDVLLENDRSPMYVTLVQHGNHVGTPLNLKGMHFVVYLTDADVATLADSNAVVESMDGKSVVYRDGKQQTVVTLR